MAHYFYVQYGYRVRMGMSFLRCFKLSDIAGVMSHITFMGSDGYRVYPRRSYDGHSSVSYKAAVSFVRVHS